MGKRRGFFAEMQHQAAVAERNRQRAQAVQVREAQRQQREYERARAAAERARVAASRADARARAEADREAKRLHVAAQEADVESRNANLQSLLADIDNVLGFTLGVDDFVDLEELRQTAEHPGFTSQHSTPIPPPTAIHTPSEPILAEIPAPTGLSGIFKKKAHEEAVAKLRAEHEQRHARWREAAAAVPMRQLEQMNQHHAAEAERESKLAADRAVYDDQCRQREAEVAEANARLDALIAAHEAGEKDAVEEYFSIVFGNSVYPEGLTVDFEQSYKPADKELEVALSLPAPENIPAARSYKYVKARDEIAETSQTVKEQRERYNTLVNAIVLRSIHEVWESDRLGHVDTISLVAAVEHIDPATGRQTATPVAAVAVPRLEFENFDLANVTPAETLKRLHAVVSPNAHDLKAVDLSAGVRG
jgi:restriction system protein